MRRFSFADDVMNLVSLFIFLEILILQITKDGWSMLITIDIVEFAKFILSDGASTVVVGVAEVVTFT